jgi:hypothetical protein
MALALDALPLFDNGVTESIHRHYEIAQKLYAMGSQRERHVLDNEETQDWIHRGQIGDDAIGSLLFAEHVSC